MTAALGKQQAKITALDLEGTEFTLEQSGLWARVWQHEYDHLEGIMIIDRMRPLDKLANRRALRDLERGPSRSTHHGLPHLRDKDL